MEGGATSTMDTITTAVTSMAQTVADNGLSVIAAVLPVLATIIAAIIVAQLGVKIVKKFGK